MTHDLCDAHADAAVGAPGLAPRGPADDRAARSPAQRAGRRRGRSARRAVTPSSPARPPPTRAPRPGGGASATSPSGSSRSPSASLGAPRRRRRATTPSPTPPSAPSSSARSSCGCSSSACPSFATRRKGNGPVARPRPALRVASTSAAFAARAWSSRPCSSRLLYWPILRLLDQTQRRRVRTRPRSSSTPPAARASSCSSSSCAVGAPIAEELFFRGLLLRSVEKRLDTCRRGRRVHRRLRRSPTSRAPAARPAAVRRGRRRPRGAHRPARARRSCCHIGFNAWTVVRPARDRPVAAGVGHARTPRMARFAPADRSSARRDARRRPSPATGRRRR